MKRRSFWVWLLILTMLVPATAYGSGYSEEQHWGFERMTAWKEKGLLGGYPDGSLRPDEPVTRAQLARLLRAVLQYPTASEAEAFTDVEPGAWYRVDVEAAAAAGIVSGYPDGSFKPNEQVKRQDAAVMLAKAFKLAGTSGAQTLESFPDGQTVSSYAKHAMQRLLAAGMMNGYSDGTLKPMKALSRAEAVTLLDKLTGELIQESGVYSDQTVDGNLVIQAAGVTLEHMTIKGNVYVTATVGDGDVHLNDVRMDGTLHINGGGTDSIYIENSTINRIVVNRLEGKVRVVIRDGSSIDELYVEHDAIIELDKESFIKLLSFMKGAEGSKLASTGTIEQLLNEAGISYTKPDQNEGSSNGGTIPVPVPTTPPKDEWTLVWSDEFDRSGTNLDDNGVDLDKWAYQLGTGSQYGLDGWGNNEEQYYRAENIAVEDGVLKITAKHEQHEGKSYTSGRLFTEPNFSQTYGKFEARMKLPAGDGLWPAFWMMPQHSVYGTWAASGEIDIMEARGRLLDEIGGAIHYGRNWPNNKFSAGTYHFPEGQDITDYHVYGLEWEPGELRWYVDGVLFQTLNNWDSWGENEPAKYAFPAPFDQPFHMILNLAVGGNYDGGRVPGESDLPAEMLVDYVRVYELTGRPYKEPMEPAIEAEPIDAPYKEAVDGSYVYDAAYEQPITKVTNDGEQLNEQYWNFVALQQFGGAGELTVEALEEERFAKASISNAGNETHSIQLIQHITVGKGRWYKLSFDAKSDASRNMAVKIGGGEQRGWSVYSDNYDIALTSELQHYEKVFQMTADTDKQARLEFNMGLSTSPIWIGNVKLEEINAPDPYQEHGLKEPLANGNHIYNGSFDLGYIHRLTYWMTSVANDAKAAFNVDSSLRELHVSIEEGGQQADAVTIAQHGISLIQDNAYELTFTARADAPRSIDVIFMNEDGELHGQPVTFNLAQEAASYTASFNIEQSVSESGTLVFWLGGVEGSVYMDNIKLVRTTDNHVGELPLELQFPLKNGDYTNGLSSWSEHVQGRYDGWDQYTKMDVAGEVLEYTVWSTGNNPWDVMLAQSGLQLKKNQTYVISLDAKASLGREAELVLENDSYHRYMSERLALTEDWQSYSFELSMEHDALLSFKLLLGKLEGAEAIGEHTVWVDHVRVEVKDARSKAFLAVNGDFAAGMDGWHTHVQGIYDGPSKASFNVDGGALHATIEHSGVNPWDVLLFQEAVPVSKGKTYVVSFDAHASIARDIEVIAENSAYARSLNQPVTLTGESQRFSYEFTMERDENVQLKFLLGKLNGTEEADVHHITIDNVQFELKGARAALSSAVESVEQELVNE
ncbi:carbohydrate binding domain-containing protein [Paenibacillus camelliae]|uniref:carbohydrate binding domain-containing protein n=1 Tax=Paenibacillus camelliae TaxID=512410 RepID=UPI00203AB118|nr:carbohydrate binding domain-containing protein [Paenibacillus camelliae]MCM3633329.1 carbohydrate binding domain-containing protein [Paenibacillus camelliae]